MKYDPVTHHRRSIRIAEYDYSSPESYFFSLVACGRECLFKTAENKRVFFNATGDVVRNVWE